PAPPCPAVPRRRLTAHRHRSHARRTLSRAPRVDQPQAHAPTAESPASPAPAPRCSPPPPRCSPPPPRSPPPRTLAQCSGAPPPFVLCLGRSGSPDPSPRAPSPSRPLRRHFDQTNHQSKLTRTMSFLRPRRVPVGG